MHHIVKAPAAPPKTRPDSAFDRGPYMRAKKIEQIKEQTPLKTPIADVMRLAAGPITERGNDAAAAKEYVALPTVELVHKSAFFQLG
jgi:hypothetical protein